MKEKVGIVVGLLAALLVAGLLFVLGNDRGPTLENAIAAFESGNNTAAIRLFDYAIESGKLAEAELAVAHTYRAYAHVFQAQYDRATLDFEKPTLFDPEGRVVRPARVAALTGAGRLDTALTEADEAVALAPADAKRYADRCNVLRLREEFEKAIVDCDRAVALDPSLPGAWLVRAKLNHDWGYPEDARHDAERALRLNPDDPKVRAMAGEYDLLEG